MATATDCPQCGAMHTSSIDFCYCGYLLAWTANSEAEIEEAGVARVPLEEPVIVPDPPPIIITGSRDHTTIGFPVATTGPQCRNGHVNPEGRTLCVRCGDPIRRSDPWPQPQVTRTPARQYQPASRLDWSSIPWLWIGGVIGLLVIALAAWFLWPDSDDTTLNPFDSEVVEAKLYPDVVVVSDTATTNALLLDVQTSTTAPLGEGP